MYLLCSSMALSLNLDEEMWTGRNFCVLPLECQPSAVWLCHPSIRVFIHLFSSFIKNVILWSDGMTLGFIDDA